jgi:hypothetical protein
MSQFKALGAVAALVLGLSAAPSVQAGEVFGAVYGHDVTFIGSVIGVGAAGREGGADFMLGLRSDRLGALHAIGSPQAHIMVSANSQDTSHFAAAGFSWPIPIAGKLYFRPGVGMAYTTGKVNLPPTNVPGLTPAEFQRRLNLYNTRIDFGSKVLFEPEIAFGLRLSEKVSVEASWVHLSNGRILGHSKKNQGLDDAGVRMAWTF